MLEIFSSLLSGFLDHVINDVRGSVAGYAETYLLSTHDLSRGGAQALTSDPALQAMYHLTLGISDALLVLVYVWAFLRSMWERGFRPHYTLKVMLPRTMAAIALAHFGLLFGQMAIDLNNVLVHAAWTTPLQTGPGSAAAFPWHFALDNPFGFPLFQLAVRLAIVVMISILALTYVIRFALLSVLLAIAPLAALCLILPETKNYARSWTRLFLITVFMQFVQVLILRFASLFSSDLSGSVMQALYGLAVLYLVLKVPGLMNASAHLESKAQHLAESTAKRAIKTAVGTHRAGS